MAATISGSTNLNIANGSAVLPSTARSWTQTQVGADVGSDTQDISNAADSAIAVPAAVTGNRFLEIFNMDPTNYIQVSIATGGSFAASVFSIVNPGTPIFIQPNAAIYAKANSAPVKIQFRVVEF